MHTLPESLQMAEQAGLPAPNPMELPRHTLFTRCLRDFDPGVQLVYTAFGPTERLEVEFSDPPVLSVAEARAIQRCALQYTAWLVTMTRWRHYQGRSRPVVMVFERPAGSRE